MGFFDSLIGSSANVRALESALGTARSEVDFLHEEVAHARESMAELEREMIGYEQVGADMADVSHAALVKRSAINRNSYYMNPVIHRAVQVIVNYVWALRFKVTHSDSSISAKISAVLRDADNRIAVFGVDALAELERELLLSGNAFIAIVPGDIASVRKIAVHEIQEIAYDPDDSQMPFLYKRVYSVNTIDVASGAQRLKSVTEYYYDARVPEQKRVSSIGTFAVHSASIVHVAADRLSNMRYGMPEMQSAMAWSRAYKEFLEDWIKILATFAKIAWKYVTRGGKRATNAIKEKLGTSITSTNLSEKNPPPTTGSMVAMSSGDQLEAMRTSGAAENPESARRVHLMTVAGSGLVETMFGDQISGVENTATHLDRPTELLIMQRQNRWQEIFTRVFAFALKLTPDQVEELNVEFPDIVGRDVREIVSALVDAATCKGLPFAGVIDMRTFASKVLHELRIPNADRIVREMYPDDKYDAQDWAVATPQDMRDQMSMQQNSGSVNDPNASDSNAPNAPSSKTTLRPGRTAPQPGRTRPNDSGPRP